MSTSPPEFQVARAFDFADPDTGPGFAPDHAVVSGHAERERLLRYLRGGAPVLISTACMHDVLDPLAGQVVPMCFRTDGEWIWTDAVEYYLERYHLAPDSRLTGHIDARCAQGHDVPDVDLGTASRAAGQLLRPAAADAPRAVWVHDK